ncbi:MAG: transposase, partial [Sideroxydans sp.]
NTHSGEWLKVFTFEQNRCSRSFRISVHVRPEWVFTLPQNMQESFNGKFRDECLSMEWFRSRAEAKVVIESWRCHYNEIRPHSSLGNLTPLAFRSLGGKTAVTEAISQV